MRLLGYRSVLHEAAGALRSGWGHIQICILRERSDRLAASEVSLAVACERSEASVTASAFDIYTTDLPSCCSSGWRCKGRVEVNCYKSSE